MSTHKFKDKDFKFSFNSLRYMEDLDFSVLSQEALEKKPLKVIPLLFMLVMGGVNSHPKIKVSEAEVSAYLDDFTSTGGDIDSLLSELIDLLQETGFFKSLQEKA